MAVKNTIHIAPPLITACSRLRLHRRKRECCELPPGIVVPYEPDTLGAAWLVVFTKTLFAPGDIAAHKATPFADLALNARNPRISTEIVLPSQRFGDFAPLDFESEKRPLEEQLSHSVAATAYRLKDVRMRTSANTNEESARGAERAGRSGCRISARRNCRTAKRAPRRILRAWRPLRLDGHVHGFRTP